MEKLYRNMTALGGVLALLHCCDPAHAQQIGDVCVSEPQQLRTIRSVVPTEGAIQCIPDSNGNYFWQPMGAGMARYDTTTTCSVAGLLRWNGSAIQFCDGTSWQSLGGGSVGKLHWDGNWTSNFYWCDPGYVINEFHFDCGCSNDTTWFDCETN